MMSRFNQFYQTLTESGIPPIFRAPTPDELTDRRERWEKVQVDEWMKEFNKRDDKRLVNGRWDVDGSVDISEMNFSKLPVKFGKVGGYFDCGRCTSLTSLDGAPTNVGYDFSCFRCISLTSLDGAPTNVGTSFSCCGCTSLTSLDGAPTNVGSWFSCEGCTSLMSLEGAPTSVDRNFYCHGCGKKFTVDEVRVYSKVKVNIHV